MNLRIKRLFVIALALLLMLTFQQLKPAFAEQNITGITLDESHIFMYARGSVRAPYKLNVTAYPGEFTPEVTWTSGNSSVATVTEGGEVKAISPGTAVITATETGSGYKATCTVTVLQVTRERIRAKWERYKPVLDRERITDQDRFSEMPRFTAPYYPGKLKPQFVQDGLNMANFVRFLAGVPDDLEIDETLANEAQHGALLLSVSEYSHFPPKPADMSDEFYNTALGGTMGNIAAGRPTIEKCVRDFIADMQINNIANVGHRRHILNQQANLTGLGFVHNVKKSYRYYTSMPITDYREEFIDRDFVAWPNQGYFPHNFFFRNDPWSVSLGGIYVNPEIDDVKVRLTRLSDNKTWNFNSSHSTPNFNDRYFNVSPSGYGYDVGAIIFRPEGIEKYQGKYKVEITGIVKWGWGEDYPGDIEFTVNFFDLDSISWTPVTSVKLNHSTLNMNAGESVTLQPTVSPSKASDKSVIYSSSNTLVATVNTSGRVTAVGPGEANIKVVTRDGKETANCRVTVKYVPLESISLSDTDLYLQGVRSKKRMLVQYYPLNASNKQLVWSSGNEEVVTVDSFGNLTAVAEGESVIMARSLYYGGIESTAIVTVTDDGIYYGDVNGDGYINVSDAIRVLRHIVGLTEIEQEQYAAADVTGSGNITVTDAIRILRYIVGLY